MLTLVNALGITNDNNEKKYIFIALSTFIYDIVQG